MFENDNEAGKFPPSEAETLTITTADLETGGLDKDKNGITEIGIARLTFRRGMGLQSAAAVSLLLAPSPELTYCSRALELQGRNFSDLAVVQRAEKSRRETPKGEVPYWFDADAVGSDYFTPSYVSEREAVNVLEGLTGYNQPNAPVVWAHNATFDGGFINAAAWRNNKGRTPLGSHRFLGCSMQFYKTLAAIGRVRGGECSLVGSLAGFGVEYDAKHRGINDAIATACLMAFCYDAAGWFNLQSDLRKPRYELPRFDAVKRFPIAPDLNELAAYTETRVEGFNRSLESAVSHAEAKAFKRDFTDFTDRVAAFGYTLHLEHDGHLGDAKLSYIGE